MQKREKEDKEREKIKLETEKKGVPAYDAGTKFDKETEAFGKICALFAPEANINLIKTTYKVAVKDKLEEKDADGFITRRLGDMNSSIINKVIFVYRLFTNASFAAADNPVSGGFQSSIFVTMASLSVPSNNKNLLRAFAPLLFASSNLDAEQRTVIFRKINKYKQGWIRTSFTLAKTPVLFVPILMAILYIFSKLIKLIH